MNTLLQEYHDRLGDALASRNRLAAVEKLHAEMDARIAALEPMAQPSMFPAGEDAPLFTLPDAAPTGAALAAAIARGDYEDAPVCGKCGRHPAESGLAYWATCGACGAAVCDTCAWHDYNDDGHYCGPACAYGVEEEQAANPYILTGDELARTEARRIAGY
jgi:hypothetical protein